MRKGRMALHAARSACSVYAGVRRSRGGDSLAIAENPISNSNLRHIDVRQHFPRESVERRKVSITHVASRFQHADFRTKELRKDFFEFHRNYVMDLER